MEKELSDYDFKSQLLEERKEKIERSNKMREKFDEEFHTEGRPEWIVNLYLELDKFISSLKGQIRKEFLESYVKYSYNGLLFCYIVLRKAETLRLWAKIPYTALGAVPLFVRDYEPVSRRVGVMVTFDDQREFLQNKEAMIKFTGEIIKKALQGMADRKGRKKTPLKPIAEVEPVKPIEIVKPSSVNISVVENGYLSINLKIHKSQKELLNRILQETIFR
ncbi:hypothetical protein ES695_00210 [Candidatus Atribacteria bacterium 1244-E10-H5-B2]|nr:MAG: hypothetical protein ES695_00210 [Candidatus Atribacteria bacterium 1244-E10-H5-B2]